MASNNDCGVRDFDMERYKLVQLFRYLWPVNHSSLSPDGKLVAVVGDDPDGLLVDTSNGQVLNILLPGTIYFTAGRSWSLTVLSFVSDDRDAKRSLRLFICISLASKRCNICHRKPRQDLSYLGHKETLGISRCPKR
jgi:hypothetical protein